jgi:hypothetical protein
MSRFLWDGWLPNLNSTVLFVARCVSLSIYLFRLQGKLLNKERPHVDPRYKTRSFAESKLVEIMEETWTFEPTERIRYVCACGGCFLGWCFRDGCEMGEAV